MPTIFSATILPCLFAGPANGIKTGFLETKSMTSIASPSAYISKSDVCKFSLTKIPPVSPICKLESFARFISGFTPIQKTTKSTFKSAPLFKIIFIFLSSSVNFFTPSFNKRSTPLSIK